MRLPLVKHIHQFVLQNNVDYIGETIETLEFLSESTAVKEEELDVIGELLSNLYGALEVQKAMEKGVSERDALNDFMQRVVGSIS